MLCTLEVDFSQLPISKERRASGKGMYYRVDYDVVMLFGLTELKCMIAWKENVCAFFVLLLPFLFTQYCWQGVERRSPAKIIYDPNNDPSS